MNVEDLTSDHYVAFEFNYNGTGTEIIVSKITSVWHNREVLCHFLHGHHSLAEYISFEDILAVGNHEGLFGIKGWSGKFDLFKVRPKLVENLKDL